MTSRNSSWNKPFLLRPSGKDYLWGGSRLNDDFCKNILLQPLAETWECSTHPDGPSYAVGGAFDGMTLREILKQHPEFLGNRGEFSILIKLIDAKADLSVQVHPDDVYAKQNEGGQLGKTEMWYVLDAQPGASLVYGLRQSLTRAQMRESIAGGRLEAFLQKIPVQKNDVFFVQPGTIHAICAGTLVAEIQESSNLTYRLYDYDRVGKDGKKRPLHIEKALDVADLSAADSPRQPIRVLKYRPGCAEELLCRCKYFEVYRMLINTERCHGLVTYGTDEHSYRVLLCIDGCGSLQTADGIQNFFKGDCFFFPAGGQPVKLHGQAQLLNIL